MISQISLSKPTKSSKFLSIWVCPIRVYPSLSDSGQFELILVKLICYEKNAPESIRIDSNRIESIWVDLNWSKSIQAYLSQLKSIQVN